MILLIIIISLLLLKLYPEYKIYILLFILLSFILSRRTEGLQNVIDINDQWNQDLLSGDDEEYTEIKISDDPVRHCYYKTKDNQCKPFPSNPLNFNEKDDERDIGEPALRKPLFFDFIRWGKGTFSADNQTMGFQKDNGENSLPGDVLSPIHETQDGIESHPKFNQSGKGAYKDIAPSSITDINEKKSYRSLFERERRSRIIKNGNNIGVYRGWSGSSDGKIQIDGTQYSVDEFLYTIDVSNLILREDFNNFTDGIDTIKSKSKYSWYLDIIKIYNNYNGSTGYFLDNLNSPDNYIGISRGGGEFNAPFGDIWGDDSNFELPKDRGNITIEDLPKGDPPNGVSIGEKYKDIRLKNSTVEELYGYIMKFKINPNSGSYDIREGKEDVEIPKKDRRFIFDMVYLVDKVESSEKELKYLRSEILEIIQRIMLPYTLNFIGKPFNWTYSEPGYNSATSDIYNAGDIDTVWADSTCETPIDNYKYFHDPFESNNQEKGENLICVDENNKVTYTSNEARGTRRSWAKDCAAAPNDGAGVKGTERDNFKRGLYVKCYQKE